MQKPGWYVWTHSFRYFGAHFAVHWWVTESVGRWVCGSVGCWVGCCVFESDYHTTMFLSTVDGSLCNWQEHSPSIDFALLLSSQTGRYSARRTWLNDSSDGSIRMFWKWNIPYQFIHTRSRKKIIRLYLKIIIWHYPLPLTLFMLFIDLNVYLNFFRNCQFLTYTLPIDSYIFKLSWVFTWQWYTM